MYNHNLIEKKWQTEWLTNKVYKFKNTNKPKYYVLDMFPYPSGSGLHLGHPKGYTATDIISRYKKLKGFDVLHPIGWDAFGLPAEQYAIDTNNHPSVFTQKNIDHFREQLIRLGFNYDYDKEVDTTDPKYYKWTQWIFAKLFENNLAEIRDIEVNWCENLKTVLANEEVIEVNGQMVSERGNHPVVKKPMKQWVLKITKYADKLIDGLNEVDWPESLKSIQRKWIGKSEGTLVNFKTDVGVNIKVFTTRVDTIYGITYIAIAPNNNLITSLTSTQHKQEVEGYVNDFNKKMISSKNTNDDISGVFLGSYAINPINNQKIPLYAANYVLNSYATGMVMGVPAHDERDYRFAKKQNLPIVYVINPKTYDCAYEDDGTHINSPKINGLNICDSKRVINEYLVNNNIGNIQVNYKLKDWIFSRQRYWGEPFPIVFDSNDKPTLVDELPILLPKMKKFNERSSSGTPLSTLNKWMHVEIGGKQYVRDANTMPQWAGSCWYYLGYLIKQNKTKYLDLNSPKSYDLFKKWLPIDLYVGGQEHAVLHLLYARFWHRFLYDINVVPTKEPFQKIINQGMILGTNGEKMSKSKGNTIDPDSIIKTHGADALRLYEMFMGPLTASLPWSDNGLNGIRKWLDRVCRLFEKVKLDDSIINNDLEVAYNEFVKKVSEDIEALSFNTAISQMMIFINKCYQYESINKQYLKGFLITLSCFAPHLAEELWHKYLSMDSFIINDKWPTFDESKLNKTTVTIPIQENGKLRDTIVVPINIEEQQLINEIKKLPKVINFINNRPIKKIIYIKNKIVNIII